MSKSTAEDIATYCANQGIGTLGTDIFVNNLPDTPEYPDNLVVFNDTAGFGPDHAMGGPSDNPAFENPSVQVLVQNVYSETAINTCYDVFQLLDGLKDQTIDSVVYLLVTALNSPFIIGKDENDRYRVACDFLVTRRPVS
jgi:hypothetical protein